MKILYVNTYFNGGGAEKVMRQLYYGIKSDEFETYCIVGRLQKNIPEDVEIVYKDFLGRCVTTFLGGCLNNTLLMTKRARKAIIECIKKNKIDIVHFHNLHSNYVGISDLEEIRKYCKNIVITLHDMWLLTGGCAHSFECSKWMKESNCNGCKGNVSMSKGKAYASRLHQSKERYFLNKGFHFVTPSKWLYRCCRQSYLYEEDIKIINNGISLKCFNEYNKSVVRKKYKLPENKKILLFVANGINNVYKGFSYLSEALMRLPDKDNYVLLVVGNKQGNVLRLPYKIFDIGYVSDEIVLSELYSAADLFILPSVADTSSFTAMEAMASGTPVLAFDTGGIPEVVSEKVGWLVPKGDSRALAAKIRDILADGSELREKTQKCRSYIESSYTEDKMIDSYKALYRELNRE